MVNQVILVGRIVEINDKTNELLIKVQRTYKNENGEYDVDILPVRMSSKIMDNVKQYCSINNLIGIKGTIQAEDLRLYVIANKITFLAGGHTDTEGGE